MNDGLCMRAAKQMIRFGSAIGAGIFLIVNGAHAYDTYAIGHINNVTFAGDDVLVRIDAPVPTNCSSSLYGWMKIPAQQKRCSRL